ncbi:MAG: hypothetical protein SFU84_03580 [Gemmatimonadales bacterium]|nr:hypothetical protein [Gemmatimonadales bacterium]
MTDSPLDASRPEGSPSQGSARADLRPRAAFRVAVTGHRWHRLPGLEPSRLQESIETQLRTIGSAVQASARPEWYSGAPPELTLLSGLADGADQIAAEAALAAGWRLHAVLPFAADQYRNDFESPASRTSFEGLLERAAAVTVLDGVAGRHDAYVPLGRVLVANSDLLFAVWDGAPALGVGGAATVVQSARRETVPIVRFDPATPATPWLEHLLEPDEGRARGITSLGAALDSLLAPPHADEILRQFLAADFPLRQRSRLFDRLVGLVAGLPASTNNPSRGLGIAPTESWSREWSQLPEPTRREAIARFATPHGWADAGALWYSASFRQAFTAIFLLTVGTVFAAGIGAADIAGLGLIPEALEVLLLGAVLFFVWRGRRTRSQDRWLQLRALAERLRHLATLWPLARTTPLVRVPEAVPGLGAPPAAEEREGWVAWYLRAVAREAGLVPGDLNEDHTSAVRQWLIDTEVEVQRRFHEDASRRSASIHHPLERAAELFVVAAILLATARLFGAVGFVLVNLLGWTPLTVVRVEQFLDPLLHALAVTLPALAAGIHGFLGTADFEGGVLRSNSIAPQLRRLANRLGQVRPIDLHEVGEVAAEIARLMEGELGIWRTGAGSRRLQA